jgi:hypothetical protein
MNAEFNEREIERAGVILKWQNPKALTAGAAAR